MQKRKDTQLDETGDLALADDEKKFEVHFGVRIDMSKVRVTDTGPSVSSMVPLLPKYVLEIHKSEDKNEVDPVFISNGDYNVLIKRGRKVIASIATVDALRRAVMGRVDPETMTVVSVPAYPFTAVPYDGPKPIGAEIEYE